MLQLWGHFILSEIDLPLLCADDRLPHRLTFLLLRNVTAVFRGISHFHVPHRMNGASAAKNPREKIAAAHSYSPQFRNMSKPDWLFWDCSHADLRQHQY